MKIYLFCIAILISTYTYSQSYQYYTREEVVADVDYLAQKVSAIHPLLLSAEKREWWNLQVSDTKDAIKDSLTQNQAYILMSSLMAKLQDSHSGLQMPFNQRQKYTQAGGLTFPFLVKIEEGSLFIDYYCGEDTSLFDGGEEILQINGVDVKHMLEEMDQLFGGLSIHLKQNQTAYYFRFLTWMIYGWESNYDLLISNHSHRLKRVKVGGVTGEVFLNHLKDRRQKNSMFDLQIDENHSIGVMKIKSFVDLSKFCAFADSSFQLIAQKHIRNLVIDIRENGGGRSVVVDSLLNYITDISYSQYKLIKTRVSKELLDYYESQYPQKYEIVKDCAIDSIYIPAPQIHEPHNVTNKFTGDVYLLTDKGTASAAATMAGVFKEWKLGEIIGEETGGTIKYFGDYWTQYTPNTHIGFFVSPKQFIQFGGLLPDRGVMPDYEIVDKRDLPMSFVYDLILGN
nr:S41 family peptidase [uncultured Carboxylicivirga sp.]